MEKAIIVLVVLVIVYFGYKHFTKGKVVSKKKEVAKEPVKPVATDDKKEVVKEPVKDSLDSLLV